MQQSNFATSHKAEKFRKQYAVVYDDPEKDASFTMQVTARSLSEATKYAAQYIKAHGLHPYEYPYFLTPALAPGSFIATYHINQK